MKDSQRILEMAKENNWVVTAAMVSETGISRVTLKYLSDNGKLERSARGGVSTFFPKYGRMNLWTCRDALREAFIRMKPHFFYWGWLIGHRQDSTWLFPELTTCQSQRRKASCATVPRNRFTVWESARWLHPGAMQSVRIMRREHSATFWNREIR